MKKQTLQNVAIQKSLTLSEQDALKVLIFMAGLEAGNNLNNSSIHQKKQINLHKITQ